MLRMNNMQLKCHKAHAIPIPTQQKFSDIIIESLINIYNFFFFLLLE